MSKEMSNLVCHCHGGTLNLATGDLRPGMTNRLPDAIQSHPDKDPGALPEFQVAKSAIPFLDNA